MKKILGMLIITMFLASALVTVASAQQMALPNLKVTSVWATSDLTEKEHVGHAIYVNNGQTYADPPFSIFLFLNNISGGMWGILKERRYITEGIPRYWPWNTHRIDSNKFYLSNPLPRLPYQIICVADFYHELWESDETDNVGNSVIYEW